MLALLKKDWRLNAVPIYGGTLLVAVPYIVVVLALIFQTPRYRERYWADDLQIAAVMGTMLTVAVTAVFGGVAFAQERRERSADFLALIPVSRLKIVASKTVIGLLVPAILWAGNFYAAHVSGVRNIWSRDDTHYSYTLAANIMVFAFGIAWFCSSFLRSPSVAACIAIGSVLVLVVVGALPDRWVAGLANSSEILFVISSPALMGLCFFVAGMRTYLGRVEP
jgi:ABC-type transport system involved in multi-copper enzyme maturation permease subunit